MKIFYKNVPGEQTNKIAAIKATRAYTGMGLKEAKDTVELAMADGCVVLKGDGAASFDVFAFDRDMKACGLFSVSSDLVELSELIEEAITVAVSLKEYKTARGLINLLPPALRKGWTIDHAEPESAKD